MPVISSHNNPFEREPDRSMESSAASGLVSKITFDILKDSPQLVAEVEAGMLDRRVLETAIVKNIDKNRYHMGMSREKVIDRVFDFMFGYGILQHYINDEDISDIDGTRYNYFTIKKHGKKHMIPVAFGSEDEFEKFCELVVIRNGGIINANDSHCRVSDEKNRLRINVSIRPRSITGAAVSIRKHRKKSYTLEDLIRLKMFNEETAQIMRMLAHSDKSILFCGKGAAGKTTALRALLSLLEPMEKVLICESDTELYPENPSHIVHRIKKANEGGRPVTLRDLIRDGLTMSLDTYCIGEIVGDEAWEFINAGYTAHRILGTIHSESAYDTFDRLLTLIKSAGVDHTEDTLRRIISKSIDVVVYLKDFKVVSILEVTGYDEKRGSIMTEELSGRRPA